MKKWYLYDLNTGLFTGRSITCPSSQLNHNIPEGCGVVPDVVDWERTRVVGHTSGEGGELVPVLEAYTPPAPIDTELQTWVWDASTGVYEPRPTLLAMALAAKRAIDTAAGDARLRYITEVPGQQGVYIRKLAQAQHYLVAGEEADVPVYVSAEARALGVTATEAATRIATIAEQWDSVLSPAIEEYRIAGKAAVDAALAAQDLATIITARDTAIQQLAAV